MRRAVLESTRTLGIRADERDLSVDDVLAADELFVTNALFGIWPVTELEDRRFALGPTTRQLMTHFGYPDAD
jgi:4-amino-4-deoxychorismate lyase